MQKIKIALIDDKQTILDRFESNYDGDEFEIHTFLSWEEAEEIIDRDFYSFHFVIFDGKGFLTKGETGEGNETFAFKVRDNIESLIRRKGRDLPFCCYTAYAEEKSINILTKLEHGSSRDTIKVFSKNIENHETDMFSYIKERYENLEETSIKKKYSDVFEVFQLGLLDTSLERDLINSIKNLSNLTDDNSKQFSRNVRPIMESIFNKLSAFDRRFVSPNYKQGDEQSSSNHIWFLAGKPKRNNTLGNYEYQCDTFMPIHLYETVSAMQRATSKTAMHNYSIPINRYTAKSYLYTLFDLILWFKELVKNR